MAFDSAEKWLTYALAERTGIRWKAEILMLVLPACVL